MTYLEDKCFLPNRIQRILHRGLRFSRHRIDGDAEKFHFDVDTWCRTNVLSQILTRNNLHRRKVMPSRIFTVIIYRDGQLRARSFTLDDRWIEMSILWMFFIPEDIRFQNVTATAILLEHRQIKDLSRIWGESRECISSVSRRRRRECTHPVFDNSSRPV